MKFATLLIVVFSTAKWAVSAPLAKDDSTAPPDVGTRAAEDLVADIAIHSEWYYNTDDTAAPRPKAEAYSSKEVLTVDGVATRSKWYYNARQIEPRNVEARSAGDDITVDGYSTRSGWSYEVTRMHPRNSEARGTADDDLTVDGVSTPSGWDYKALQIERRDVEARSST